MKMYWWFDAVRILAGILVVVASLRARHALGAAAPSNACSWQLLETRNFRIHAYSPEPIDTSIGEECERHRNQITTAWFGRKNIAAWQPKCEIVLHGTSAGYQAAVGMQGISTVASSRIDRCDRGIVARRIDVLATRSGWLKNMPHEITHQILAEHFADAEVPRWIDEGMALAADDADKQAAHRSDLDNALRQGRLLRFAQLTSARDYPSQAIDVFYGQSLSLVEYLVELRGRRTFATFVDSAQRCGLDEALRRTYGIDGAAGLERGWLDWLFCQSNQPRVANRTISNNRR